MGKLLRWCPAVLFLLQFPVFAQAQDPVVIGVGDEQGASMQAPRGAIGYVFGSNFGAAADTTVTIAGLTAPVLSVDGNRIRVLFPSRMPVGTVPLRVAVNGRASNTIQVVSAASVRTPRMRGPAGIGTSRLLIKPGELKRQPASILPVPFPAVSQTTNASPPGITYTCDPTVTAVWPTACQVLNTTIASLYSTAFSNATASIYVQMGAVSAAQSNWSYYLYTYSDFRAALLAAAAGSNDYTAIATIPSSNPFGSRLVGVPGPLERALGLDSTSCLASSGCHDGIITVSNTLPLYFRSGTITGSQFDFYTLVEHETDEILGTASCAFACAADTIFPADLFRYHSNGSRSFAAGTNNACTASDSTNACFSIDTIHMLQHYNNTAAGGDAGDWVENCGAPLVQDSVICGGTGNLDIASNAEILALDVVGYHAASAPPSIGPVSVSPDAGSGLTQTFTFQFTDPNGFGDLTAASVLINTTQNGSGACYFTLVPAGPAAGTVSLADNANDGNNVAGSPLAVPSGSGIHNSQCTIGGSGSFAGAGNTLTVTLPIIFATSFAGNKTVYLEARNSTLDSGWKALGAWTVPASGSSAQAVSVSPSSGAAGRQVFSFTARDAAGFSHVQYMQFLVSKNGVNAANACYVSYDPAANVFYLLSDDMTQWYGLIGGSNKTTGNAQCTIYGATSGSTKSGTDVVANVDISFRSGFAGSKSIYQFVGDTSGGTTGWMPMGTHNDTGDPNAIELVSFSPSSGTGVSPTFTAVVGDGAGAATIAFTQFVMNGSLNGYNGCFIHYDRASNVFFLLSDNGTAWSGLVAGSASQVSNSQCTLHGAGSGGATSGSDLTIKYQLDLSPAFSAANKIYMQAADNAGVIEVWHQTGAWTR